MCSSTSLIPAPLSLQTRSHSANSDSTIFSRTEGHLDLMVDPFGCALSNTDTSHRALASATSDCTAYCLTEPHSLVTSTTPTPVPSPTLQSSADMRLRRLQRTLNAVTKSIDSFPEYTLHLDSPSILAIRASNISAATYLAALQRIFPAASSFQLSAIAAWIIVDVYFSRALASKTELELQSQSSQAPSHQHLVALASKSNESLARIPTKARDLLGISSPQLNLGMLACNERQLLKRVHMVMPSVYVVNQKLMESIRGQTGTGGGFDEDVWRSLRVLIEVIEGNGERMCDQWL